MLIQKQTQSKLLGIRLGPKVMSELRVGCVVGWRPKEGEEMGVKKKVLEMY